MWFTRTKDPKHASAGHIPSGWLPHVHRDKIFWLWHPPEWSIAKPLSGGSCLALTSECVLAEVFCLRPPEDNPESAAFASDVLKKSIIKSHPDARVVRAGNYSPPEADLPGLLGRMKALGLMGGYGFITEMMRPVDGFLFTVNYQEPGNFKSTTDCFSLHRGDLVVQVNMKTLASDYDRQSLDFERVAASVMLGKFA